MDTQPDRSRDRRRFLLALSAFLLWVAALGVLAVTTGSRPLARLPVRAGR